MIAVGHGFHFFGFYGLRIGFVGLHQDIRGSQPFVLAGDAFTQLGHAVGGDDFAAHEDGLFEGDAAHVEPS